MSATSVEDRRRLAEDFGLLFESWGLPRMAGRIFGWLLVCDPPHQSANDLYEAIDASKGSISTAMRLLEPASMVEKFTLPGERSTYYRVRDRWWTEVIGRQVEGMEVFIRTAEKGLEMLAGEKREVRRRLVELKDAYSFFVRELPKMIERYEQELAKKGRA